MRDGAAVFDSLRPDSAMDAQRFDTVIIGAGQAGGPLSRWPVYQERYRNFSRETLRVPSAALRRTQYSDG